MKKSCVFIFACLWFGNAFTAPSAEDAGVPESVLARIEQAITIDLCSSVDDIRNTVLVKRYVGEGYYMCHSAIIEPTSKEQALLLACSYSDFWNDQKYVSNHTISCPVETEETENIDDTDTEDTE